MTAEVKGLHEDAQEAVREVLNEAYAQNLKEVVVLGIDQHGEIYSDATEADAYRIMWLLESYKFELLTAAKKERQEQG
jgi:hypothetical protein